jgi:hypothetical protein
MIKKTQILLLALCVALVSCQTLQDYATPENARTAAALACSNALTWGVAQADQVKVAGQIFSAAHAVRTLAGGHVPTVTELQSTLEMYLPNSGRYATLVTNLSGIYGGLFSRLQGNSKLAAEYLEAIAAGCEDSATPFLPKVAVAEAVGFPGPITGGDTTS